MYTTDTPERICKKKKKKSKSPFPCTLKRDFVNTLLCNCSVLSPQMLNTLEICVEIFCSHYFL